MNLARERRHPPQDEPHIDPQTGYKVIKIFSGGYHICTQPGEMLATILGSCIATCIRDPLTGIGGMNHFLLPGEAHEDAFGTGARYGVNAMECLINGILSAGGARERLEVKIFGGGNVTSNSIRIGSKNAAFARQFLKKEGFQVIAEDLEGDIPRRVHYFPDSGRVMLRKLRRQEDLAIVQSETTYAATLTNTPCEGDIELFG